MTHLKPDGTECPYAAFESFCSKCGWTAECDGICVMASDIMDGMSYDTVAYPHPGCPLHAPGEKCGCGQRMCMDCGGPWCAICQERVPSILWGDTDGVCDTCYHLVGRMLTELGLIEESHD